MERREVRDRQGDMRLGALQTLAAAARLLKFRLTRFYARLGLELEPNRLRRFRGRQSGSLEVQRAISNRL